MVMLMNLSKKLLTLFAIFCVILSASAVCAADYDGYAGSNYQDMNVNGIQNDAIDMDNSVETDGNEDALEPGAGLPLENQTSYVAGNTTDNATGNSTGNITGNTTNNTTGNITGNTTGNTTAIQHMLSTGNPILVLLVVSGIAGGYAVIRRNK